MGERVAVGQDPDCMALPCISFWSHVNKWWDAGSLEAEASNSSEANNSLCFPPLFPFQRLGGTAVPVKGILFNASTTLWVNSKITL